MHSTRLTVLKYAFPFAAVFGIGLASGALDPRIPDAQAAPAACTAEVLLHEDNSYSGLAFYEGSRKIAHAWAVVPKPHQNKVTLQRTSLGVLRVAQVDWTSAGPVWKGTPCATRTVRS